MVQESGNWYRAIKAVTTHNVNPTTNYSYWELNYVRANTTLFIGVEETFPNLLLAWNYIANCHVAQPVYLHLYISSFHGDLVEYFTSQFSLDHPSGANISILGDNANNIVLYLNGSSETNGLLLDSNHSIASISNIELVGRITAPYETAIHADSNASISNVSGIIVDNFSQGIEASNGASISCANNLVFETITDIVVFATNNGVVTIQSGLGSGDSGYAALYATEGGTIIAPGVTFNGDLDYDVEAIDNGFADVSDSSFSNAQTGIFSGGGSRVMAFNCNFSGDGTDEDAELGSIIVGIGNQATTQVGAGSYIFS